MENTKKYFPESMHFIMESVNNGNKIYTVGYKYSSRKGLIFISTYGEGGIFFWRAV